MVVEVKSLLVGSNIDQDRQLVTLKLQNPHSSDR